MQFSDFATPAFYENPYPMYEHVRQAGDLVPIAPGVSVSGRHGIVSALLRDRRMGRNYLYGVRLRYGEEASRGAAFQAWNRMMLLMNPPEHTVLRSALNQAFHPRQIAALQPLVVEIANELVDAFVANGQADLMRDFALPLPMRVICRLLDLPYGDAKLLIHSSRLLLQTLEMAPMSPAQLEAANTAAVEMQDYFRRVVAERRRRPGEDPISRLLTIEVDGQRLEEEDLIANVMLLFMAGFETTANMIGNALIALHRHPGEWRKLIERPELSSNAAWECIRFDGSSQMALRVALTEVEIAGRTIPAGHMVYLLLGAANRDPAVFAQPDRLHIEREESEVRHVTFGGGIHYCLGARLAHMELQTALETLSRRLPELRLQELDQLPWLQRHTLHGVERLSASWSVAVPA